MPIITFDYGRSLTRQQKTELVELLTEGAQKVTGIRKAGIVVMIRESSPENVGIGGRLLADRDEGG